MDQTYQEAIKEHLKEYVSLGRDTLSAKIGDELAGRMIRDKDGETFIAVFSLVTFLCVREPLLLERLARKVAEYSLLIIEQEGEIRH